MNASKKCEELDQHLRKLTNGSEREDFDLNVFRRYFAQFVSVPPTIDWSKMKKFDAERLLEEYDHLPKFSDEEAREILSHVVVIKLNGGLGTTMGCAGPKSLIPIRDGKTFLDFAIEQNELLNKRYQSDVPLYLMDSYRTEQTTAEWLKERGYDKKVFQFVQSKCPRIFESTLMPVPNGPKNRLDDGWYPPGHGNIFASLKACGLLDKLIDEGRNVIFVSNVDNTAAAVDVRIASVICREDVDYVMEITEKTQQDIKGGTLIEYDGAVKHLELPHVPEDKVDEFCSLKTFKTFNTNNIWVDLKAVQRKLNTMKLEVLPNKKKLKSGESVIQLESAIGGAIRNFERVRVVSVPRSRFLPVKKTQDMLVVMGNSLMVDETSGVLRLNPKRQLPRAPIVQLSTHYDVVAEYLSRFPHIPDMIDLESLIVSGDVKFGKDVKLRGRVHITGNGTIPDGVTIDGNYEL
ncbi:UTP--glucose-1-phosphate uridylyltransferase [Aphelenchoides besseyi]|nr:UTP--glucose-1-phosphate uridylyltransferase [Aphelenchoides besseyi]KAI6232161.1 UTP--glucose-1-phosphate uridylyltransferase [Aphelenchoides besseyi]